MRTKVCRKIIADTSERASDGGGNDRNRANEGVVNLPKEQELYDNEGEKGKM